MNLVEANLAIVPLAVIALTSLAVFTDLRNRRIPNWLTVSAFGLGLAFHLFAGGWSGLLQSLGGFATGFGLLLVLWLIGGGGGGDVKLMGAIGAWVGPTLTLIIFIASTVCAVLCVVTLLLWRLSTTGKSSTASANLEPQTKNASQRPLRRKSDKTNPNSQAKVPATSPMQNAVPYAVPAAMATWTVVLLQFI